MGWTDKLKVNFEHEKNYRVWSLSGQGFLKLTGPTSADFRGTDEESSSIITAKNVDREGLAPFIAGFRLEFQEEIGETKYALHKDGNDVKVKVSKEAEKAQIFCVKYFGKGSDCFCRALVALGQGPEDSEKKCLASNSEHELYLKTFNEDSPHQDTIFLITEVLG